MRIFHMYVYDQRTDACRTYCCSVQGDPGEGAGTSRDECMRIRDSCANSVILTIMAAVRRVIFKSLSLSLAARNALFRSPVKDKRCTRTGLAVAVGVAAGGAVLYYYYSEKCGFGGRKAPINRTVCRALLPSLPAVAAKEKV